MKLHREGWSNNQIANALKFSLTEVELIIEMGERMR